MVDIWNALVRLWADDGGIASVEYAVLLGVIGGGVFMGAEVLGNSVGDQLTDVAAWFGPEGCDNNGQGAGFGGGNGGGGDQGAGSGNSC